MFKRIAIVFVLVVGGVHTAKAQLTLTNTPVSDTLRPDLTKYLPPLYMLVDTAIANDPRREVYTSQAELYEHQMTVQKRSWLKEISIGATYTPLVNLTPQWTNINGELVSNPNQNQQIIGFGSSIYANAQLPLFYWATNKAEIRKLESQAASSMAQGEESERLIAARVTELYNNLFMYQRMLEINQKAIQMGKMGVELGEEKFRNGQIELSELAQLYDLMTKYGLDYERSYSAYRSTYRELERIVGIPLSKFKF